MGSGANVQSNDAHGCGGEGGAEEMAPSAQAIRVGLGTRHGLRAVGSCASRSSRHIVEEYGQSCRGWHGCRIHVP